MITSSQNPKVQYVRALQARSQDRRESGAFVVEGVRLAEEALQAGWQAKLVFFTDDLSMRGKGIVEGYEGRAVEVVQVSSQVMRAASDTQTPQGILVVLEQRPSQLPAEPHFLLISDGLRDPGNLGSILRTAAAAGVQAALLSPGGVDPFAPKVVRAAMGAHFRLSVVELGWQEIHAYVHPPPGRHRINVYLADAAQGEAYSQADFRIPLAIMVGSEAGGSGEEADRLADRRLHIPMPGGSESLNVAAAGAILLFEVVRQRLDHP